MSGLLTDDLRSHLGRTATYHAPEEIGRAAIRYFALAIADPNPLFIDVEYARQHGYEDVVAPPTFVLESNQYMTGDPDAFGYIGHSWDIDIPGTRLIRGGHEYQFLRPVYPHHRLTVEWTITNMTDKRSRDGIDMVLVESEACYSNQDGDLLAVNRETLIYQAIG